TPSLLFFLSSRRRHTRSKRDWSSDVCSSDLGRAGRADVRMRCPHPRGRRRNGATCGWRGRCNVPWFSTFLPAQTRRRLGGRQPLWGWGVTSEIVPTSRPVAWSERIAVSRPEPGPLTKTSTFFMPCSCALRAAFSAASWAAKGVDLREPLKPTWPEDAQDRTAPVGSVIETMVLLNVLLMWAW